MLKTAYQLGVQVAFNEIDVNQLVKEAFMPRKDLVAAVGRGAKRMVGAMKQPPLATGGGFLSKLRGGADTVRRTFSEAGSAMGRGWANLSPRQQALTLAGLGTAGAGGAGLGAASYFGDEGEE